MKKLFRDIRQGNIEEVMKSVGKKQAIVNETFDGKEPKKDIGQSPLQVAIKCGEFEIIDFLLDNGADPDFMENPATVLPHSTCMPVLQDAINCAMSSLLYKEFDKTEKYVLLIDRLLKMGANPNKETINEHPINNRPAIGALCSYADEPLRRYDGGSAFCDSEAYEISKKAFFDIFKLLDSHGADFDKWLDEGKWLGMSNRKAYLEEFVPTEELTTDYHSAIRKVLREYFAED